MRRSLLSTAVLLPLLILTLTGCSITKAMRVENREVIDVQTMIGELRETPLLFVGERHDAPSHHRLQLDILKALKAQGKPLAIGMEMFEDTSQRAVDAWSAGKVPVNAFRKVFAWNWRNISWELYQDILLFARDNHIPIIALNPPREVVQRVSREGFASLTGEQLRLLPAGIDPRVSDAYLNFIRSAYPVHGRSGDAYRNFCQAQMLRNRVMARRIGDYRALHPERTIVVLAGGGHARETGGIPAELGKVPYKIVLPPVPGLTSDSIAITDAHYLLEEPFSWLFEML